LNYPFAPKQSELKNLELQAPMDLSPALKIRNMMHWDQMSFLRERGEKILARKLTLETTMEMEVAQTLPWRWSINAVVARCVLRIRR
jgi:hypothetical protein